MLQPLPLLVLLQCQSPPATASFATTANTVSDFSMSGSLSLLPLIVLLSKTVTDITSPSLIATLIWATTANN